MLVVVDSSPIQNAPGKRTVKKKKEEALAHTGAKDGNKARQMYARGPFVL